jgi:hypothetical protein
VKTQGKEILDDLYKVKVIDTNKLETSMNLGRITERDKFTAAKQILLGLAVLYVLTLAAYLLMPQEGGRLIDICTTTFPPLATLILVAYFREKPH